MNSTCFRRPGISRAPADLYRMQEYLLFCMTLNDTTTREVLDVLDAYVKYYNGKNLEKVLSLFANDVSGFGTGKEESITNLAELKDQLRQDLAPANSLCLDMQILATGGVMPAAWVTAFCTITGKIAGKNVLLEGRMTAVLTNHGGRWLFEQIHFSVPDTA
jgi:ketosteroid isomerase-like protein